ncbi:hypothetical protein ABGB14_30915 [Nonomuraea sp. B10E15]|uniref:hypothetical protein n=1 Tax=Nonomuraea sp. B10E15 TaxID=3153560 RepID=UPI00325C3A75
MAAIIDVLADAEGMALELGELLHHVLKRRVAAPPSEIHAQLKRLVKDGRVWPVKDGGEAYALPEKILERLEAKSSSRPARPWWRWRGSTGEWSASR